MCRPLFLALFSFLLFIGLALPSACQLLLPGDAPVYNAIQARRSPPLDSFSRTMKKAGNYKVLVPVGVGVLLWKVTHQRLLLLLGLYALGVLPLETGAKLAVARPRPRHYLMTGPPLSSSHGFPSGHALASTALYGMLLVLLRRRVRSRGWRRVITGGILLLILLIGCSRVYVGAHWPSDVLGGFALGGAYCSLAVAVYERSKRRADAPTRIGQALSFHDHKAGRRKPH